MIKRFLDCLCRIKTSLFIRKKLPLRKVLSIKINPSLKHRNIVLFQVENKVEPAVRETKNENRHINLY